ncbi:hypothetical protein CONLIGDRAFT_686658 [Coniochaeta ligniaria NRRL 30616]|uniref:HNH nuclease domain-containing protein n=1 Tax=Coniochaeta ligniaria NRRL 30616 TaxID=1408157 RepID=A0A1J7I771_9PEZI|nr:hypothetical protein CONLIGDRAFT_686658 [Coniochaeta ligniaria NRRL 30616]
MEWARFFGSRALGKTDYSWNIVSLTPTLRRFCGKRLFGLTYMGMERVLGTAEVNVSGEFWWMFSNGMDPLREICPQKDGHKFLIDLHELHDSPTLGPDGGEEQVRHGVSSVYHAEIHRPLVSGQNFVVHCDSKADAEKMKAMLEFQWICQSLLPSAQEFFVGAVWTQGRDTVYLVELC